MYRRRETLIVGTAVLAFAATACGSGDPSTTRQATLELPTSTESNVEVPPPGMGGQFRLPDEVRGDENAFTYDESAVPVDSNVTIESESESGRTTVTIEVSGLAPNRDFGVHVHTKPCGLEPADSGPHYQNDADPAATPESPSTDPAYANPQNEVWLDITTDADGDAQASSTVAWEFRDDEARSVVLHAQHTKTHAGEAGMAGDRLACVDEVLAFAATACGSGDPSTTRQATLELPTSTESNVEVPPPGMGGQFRLPDEVRGDENAFTYDESAVPVDSNVTIESESESGRTTVTIEVSGLAPNRDFGVHVHTKPCGLEPADSGPHYQNDADPAATPESPSTDPAYANPQNEVWLDITTDADGDAQASSTVAWEFRDDEARSVVLHAQHTKTHAGEAGMAGDRLACVDEDF